MLCIFIFDVNILRRLDNPADRRVSFIYRRLIGLKEDLEKSGSSLVILAGTPDNAFSELTKKWNIHSVYANEDYEPEAIIRDEKIRQQLSVKNISTWFFKDQVILSGNDLVKPNGEPYTVFTPYSKKWLAAVESDRELLKPFPSAELEENFLELEPQLTTSLESLGFVEVDPLVKPLDTDSAVLSGYGDNRNKLYLDGTSHAGVHLRFGTVSVRSLALKGSLHSAIFLSELIWRDFFQSIIFHFPKVGAGASFKPAYDNIQWRNNEEEFQKWCAGETGYPIVDAGMRELLNTGFMHNRARMITASFLCKHLLIDWRWGEAWFAEKLLDFDLAANNGNWQWVSGSGCDAAPYFRIFNPYTQQQKFDPEFIYIKKWIPEFGTGDYPNPLVEHDYARKRCLEAYKKALR